VIVEYVTPVAFLGRQNKLLLLSTDDVVPVEFFDAEGDPVEAFDSAFSGRVTYRGTTYSFLIRDIDQVTVH